jgi:hypothetical protein
MINLADLFSRAFPGSKWKEEYATHPLIRKVYPKFDVQVIVPSHTSPLDPNWIEWARQDPSLIPVILSGKKGLNLSGGQEILLVFPERWLSPPELHNFLIKLHKHPQAGNTYKLVQIITQSPLLLSGFFGEQVRVLDAKGEFRQVKGGLFGTDQGEIYMNLFALPTHVSSIANSELDELLATDWSNHKETLKKILPVLGCSFTRAELRAILKAETE